MSKADEIVNSVLAGMERLITRFSRDGMRTFFDPEDFAWVKTVEAGTPHIRNELEAVMKHREQIPNLQDLSEPQKVLTEGEQWKTFFLYGFGVRVAENCALCPETDRLVRQIPGMSSAMFSILAPGKHVPAHSGPYKGVLRYHLGVVIPMPESSCRIRVGDETRTWREGRSLIFDDRHDHEVWNDSNEYRVVLFVDFIRPLPLPLDVLNRTILRLFSLTPFVTVGMERARAASRQMTARIRAKSAA